MEYPNDSLVRLTEHLVSQLQGSASCTSEQCFTEGGRSPSSIPILRLNSYAVRNVDLVCFTVHGSVAKYFALLVALLFCSFSTLLSIAALFSSFAHDHMQH